MIVLLPHGFSYLKKKNEVVSRTVCGKLMVSDAKREYIDRSVAFHLGVVARAFEDGSLDEDYVYNFDETHFIIDMVNKRTLGVRGEDQVSFADVVSGTEGFTVVVKIRGGSRAKVTAPFLIFKNQLCSYPIKGTKDDDPHVSYCSSKKGFMTSDVLAKYFAERKVNAKGCLLKRRSCFVTMSVAIS
ncbi:hypothetical protein GEMRC1_006896 [Eukaryota sp. GEM-RC1]